MCCAELISFNAPGIMLEPNAYIGYGVLYVFFIHRLIQRGEKKWSTVYLYGMLVGIITEAFLPKVLFFGWDASSFNAFGIAWFELLILTFFYHPFFSFMMPVYICKKWLYYPFQVDSDRFGPWFIPGIIIMTVFSVANVAVTGGLDLIGAIASTGILLIILFLNKSKSALSSISLSKKTRIVLGTIALLMYAYYFLVGEVEHGGRLPRPEAFIFICLYIIIIGLLIWKTSKPLTPERKENKVYQSDYSMRKVIFALLGFWSLILIGILLSTAISGLIGIIMCVLLLGGSLIGIIYFVMILFKRV
jgi:hypothetical protein